MKKSLLFGGSLVVALAVVGFGAQHLWVRHLNERSYTALCRAFLEAEASLPSPSAVSAIKRLTAPGTEANLLAGWLKEQDQVAEQASGIQPAGAFAALSQVTYSGSKPIVLSAKFTVRRRFRPRGSNVITGRASFWINPGPHPTIEALSINTNPPNNTKNPDAFNLNLWNLVPAAPLPHGQ
ncbi:MAG: hypothetical protein M1272_03565 [Firmicutes bacterium]|nr:hypothetical protein [Bacillota bacterium]